MGRSIRHLDLATLKAMAIDAFTQSGLPMPRDIEIEEQCDSEGEDVIIIWSSVAENDDLGTGRQRAKAGGALQAMVWDAGDDRSTLMFHKIVSDSKDVAA